jgi:preprotein translocase subunit SecG
MLLYYAISTVHILVCIILVMVVLLQSGKGADLAGAFGGGATQTAFGSRGPASFLSKMTTIAAVVFMMTSIALSMIPHAANKTEGKSVLETTKGKSTQPEKKAPAAQHLPPMTKGQVDKAVEEETKKQQTARAPNQQKPPASIPEKSQPPANKK